MKKFLLSVLLVASIPALAAPFCVVKSYGTNCWYYNMNDCSRAAGSDGACIVNQQEVEQPSAGGTPFCVVTGYATNCWYHNAESCRQAAASNGGACVVNPNR